MAQIDPKKPDPKLAVGAATAFAAKPVANTIEDHINVQLPGVPKLLVAILAFTLLDLGRCRILSVDWIAEIVVRDLLITWLTAGLWDWVLFASQSPFSRRMRPYKFNPQPVRHSQFMHDIFWSNVATLVSSAIEVAVLHGAATGHFTLAQDWATWSTLLWLLTMPYWRLLHFYSIHRFMHAWHIKGVPDVGAFMYKHVHSLHHKSKNPSSWSGISMHPVESTLYYTAFLIPVLAGAHPIVFLFTKVDLTMSALVGHSGFGDPGGASQAHWLHHHTMRCNYGEAHAPMDFLMGTFYATEDDFMAAFDAAGDDAAVKTRAPLAPDLARKQK